MVVTEFQLNMLNQSFRKEEIILEKPSYKFVYGFIIKFPRSIFD
jgi:hypothetical protein